MRTKGLLLAVALASLGAATAIGQGQGQPPDPERTPGVQAGQDPKWAPFVAMNCKTPPAAPAGRGRAGGPPGPGGPGGPGAAAGRGPVARADFQAYEIKAIPGVIAAGQKWKILWEDQGNNADGIVGMDDGSLLLAQNDKSDVVKIDKNGKASVVYTDTYTGGALAGNKKGQLFIAERAFHPAIWLLQPQRKLFVNMYNGDYLDCVGPGVLNDLVADSKGGLYMTFNGVRYVNPQGVMSGRFGTVGGNGIILSPDEKTLYVTGRVGGGAGAPPAPAAGGAPGPAPAGPGGRGPGANSGLVAFDVQPDGSLTNERQFNNEVCGDGSTIDSAGRIYCTGNGNAIAVVDKDGKTLGMIPTPRGVISVAFGGPDKKTLFAVGIRDVQVMSIPMLAQGYKRRSK